MIQIKYLLLLTKNTQELERRLSSDTLVGEDDHELLFKKSMSKDDDYYTNRNYQYRYNKKDQPYLYQFKRFIEQVHQLNEQWQKTRAMKRQRKREKRPQDGRTNPFE